MEVIDEQTDDEEKIGSCRYGPPTVEQSSLDAVFPYVTAEHWCFKWEPQDN
jgi:hypothetical protein